MLVCCFCARSFTLWGIVFYDLFPKCIIVAEFENENPASRGDLRDFMLLCDYLFLCTLQRQFNFVQFVAELLVGFGKVGYGLAGVQNCCVVAFANVLPNLRG